MNLKRPTSVAEMRASSKGFATDDGIARGLAFRPEPSDVFITPFPKCGTTWVQQIVQGLRTRGSMDFDEITAVVPWLELAHDMGIDLQAAQPGHPRAFKSHLTWEKIPKGGRYINVYRDPKDALLSMYRFMEGWMFEPGSISLSDYARELYLDRGDRVDYWTHAASWWRQRKSENVLLLCFEHMKQDLGGVVRRIADFIACPLDEELYELVVAQSGFAFMKRHAHQFDDHLIRETRDQACGLPPGGDSVKVREGKSGHASQQLEPDIVERLDRRWAETMSTKFGLTSYRHLAEQLAP